MNNSNNQRLVSIHGGHSREFCCHARDTLEEMIQTYIQRGFSWVGITEHMPPVNDAFLYDDEVSKGMTAKKMYRRFERYILTCRALQKKYRASIDILVGFETETYEGYPDFIKGLIQSFNPDYMVGSVHHVNNLEIDTSENHYIRATESVGGIRELYCRYFDQQYEMIQLLKPQVIGHFDLIRIFDTDYVSRMEEQKIKSKMIRNLVAIQENDLILDYNMRALLKGAKEPYLSSIVLEKALELNIQVTPGDDSHDITSVGQYVTQGIKTLQNLGFSRITEKPTRLPFF